MARRIARTKPGRDGKGGKRSRKGNPASGPGECDVEHWGWMPAEMMAALINADLSRDAFRCLLRLWVEHCGQGRMANGELVCTYGDFQDAGVCRSRIRDSLAQLEQAGFIRIRRNGRIAGHSRPNTYRLTWMGAWDGDGLATVPPSNEWKALLAADGPPPGDSR